MIRLLLTRGAVVVGGLALSLAAGAGVASADPVYGPMTDTTCTSDQALAALHAENPQAEAYLNKYPANIEFIRVFANSSPEKRVDLLNQVKNNPGADMAFPVFQQMFTTCNNY
jgi:hemophore-related protein